MTTNRIAITPRIEACLECGDAETLSLALAGWDQEELRLLHREMRDSYHNALQELDEDYIADCRKYDPLLSPAGRQLLDERYRDVRAGLAEVFAEIEGVVRAYLKDEAGRPS